MAGKTAVIRARMEAVRRSLAGAGFDFVLATSPASLRWLSGMTDLRWIMLSRRTAVAMPARLAVQAARSVLSGAMNVLKPVSGWKPLLDEMGRAGRYRMGFEDRGMTVSVYNKMMDSLSGNISMVPSGGLFEELRAVKFPDERKSIMEASGITAKVADWLPLIIVPGMTERDLAARVDSLMRLSGADSPAFDTIALSGERTAMPHGVAGSRRIRKGDLVLVDFGAKVDGYHSDCTRTISAGMPTNAQKRAYLNVYRAYSAARAVVRPGRGAEGAWRAANRSLGRLGKYFIHGLGHGVGLEIHEAPSLSYGSSDVLKLGQFVTVEPGIYIPGWGGIRLEDTVKITSHGAIPVTGKLPHELPVAGKPVQEKGG